MATPNDPLGTTPRTPAQARTALGAVQPPPPTAAPMSVADRIAQAQAAANAQVSALSAAPPPPAASAAPPTTPPLADNPNLSMSERIAQAQAAADAQTAKFQPKPAPSSTAPVDEAAQLKRQATRLASATTMPDYNQLSGDQIKREAPNVKYDASAKGANPPPPTSSGFRAANPGAPNSMDMRTARPDSLLGRAVNNPASRGLLKMLGTPLMVADTATGAYNDVTNPEVTQGFGQSLGIDNKYGQMAATGLASAADVPAELVGRVSRLAGYDPSTGDVGKYNQDGYGGFKDLFMKEYDTPMDKARKQAGTSYDTLTNMGIQKLMGATPPTMPDMSRLSAAAQSMVAPTGAQVTPEQRAAAAAAAQPGAAQAPPSQPGAARTGDLTVSVNGSDNTYDLSQYESLGSSGIYRSKANPNEFIGRGKAPDPNAPAPKPAYTFVDNGVDARNAARMTASEARSRYDYGIRKLEERFAEGKMGPRDYSNALANINQNYASEINQQQQRADKNSGANSAVSGSKSDEMSYKDAIKLGLDLEEYKDRKQDRTRDRETKNANALREQLTVMAGADESKAKRYNQLLGSLPDEIRSMGLSGAEGDREFLKQLIPALDNQVQAQNQSANALGGYVTGGVAGAFAGGMMPRVGAGVGAVGDGILSLLTRNPKLMQVGPMRKMLGNRAATTALGAGVGVAASASLRPSESALPDMINHGQINPNDPTQLGLQSGSAQFKDYFTDPNAALAMDTGSSNRFRTPSGYIPELNPDDQEIMNKYLTIMKQAGLRQ